MTCNTCCVIADLHPRPGLPVKVPGRFRAAMSIQVPKRPGTVSNWLNLASASTAVQMTSQM